MIAAYIIIAALCMWSLHHIYAHTPIPRVYKKRRRYRRIARAQRWPLYGYTTDDALNRQLRHIRRSVYITDDSAHPP